MITQGSAGTSRQHLIPREIDIARQRLVLAVIGARKNLLLASPATPAAARLELVGKLAAARNALVKHPNK